MHIGFDLPLFDPDGEQRNQINLIKSHFQCISISSNKCTLFQLIIFEHSQIAIQTHVMLMKYITRRRKKISYHFTWLCFYENKKKINMYTFRDLKKRAKRSAQMNTCKCHVHRFNWDNDYRTRMWNIANFYIISFFFLHFYSLCC